MTGQIVSKERMGKQTTMLDGMIVPVTPARGAVYTLTLYFARAHDAPENVFLSISPYFIETGIGHYLNCHSLGLWRDKAWTTAEAREGNDGWWVVVEGDHDLGTSGSHLDESVAAAFPISVLAELTASEHAGGQVCDDKFELSIEQRALLQEFLGMTLPPAKSTATPDAQ